MEVVRYANIGPYGIQHVCTREITLNGKLFPARTLIQGMYTEILKGEYWNDGENFRPERFLDKTGKLLAPGFHRSYVPFSAGRRGCLAESLAKLELFLVISQLISKYKFLPDTSTNLPTMVGVPGLFLGPQPHKVIIVARKNL